MSKTDELKKEAEEYAEQCYGWCNNDQVTDVAIATYITSAEPREKRIEELEKNLKLWTDTKEARENIFFQQKRKIEELKERCNQLLKDKGNLTDELAKWKDEWQEQVQKAIDEGWERTKLTSRVRKLEQHIEKMKDDVKQEQSYWNSGEMQYDLYQRLLNKWEIKE